MHELRQLLALLSDWYLMWDVGIVYGTYTLIEHPLLDRWLRLGLHEGVLCRLSVREIEDVARC